jgi:choice-of-anchor A domain-containing protein/uncharacterized repeat protein (TIGR01451 family)
MPRTRTFPGRRGADRWWRRPVATALTLVLGAVVAAAGAPPAIAAPPSGPAFNPVSGNQGFLAFVQGNAALNTNSSEGPIALGGTLSISQTNLALGRAISASSASGTLVAANANDGDVNTYWQSSGALPQTLTVDLASTRTINRIILRLPPAFTQRTQTITIQQSLDAVTFTPLVASNTYTFNPVTGNTVTIGFGSSNTRFIRLVVTGNSAVAAGQIAEFEVYPPAAGQGNQFNLATATPGTFTAPGDARPTALLIGGRINWDISAPNGSVNVQNSGYVKLGDLTGTSIAQRTGDPTHLVVVDSPYPSQPNVSLTVTQPTASVNQTGLINFPGAFATYRSRAANLAVCDNTVVLRDAGGSPLPATIAPGTNAYVTLTPNTQNTLNIRAGNLANISTLTFTNRPNAATPLIINVYTGGVGDNFSWIPPAVSGLQDVDAGYMLWNFATATWLTTSGSNPIRGTVFAPAAGFYQYDSGGLLGNVVAASYSQGGPAGEPLGGALRNFPFATTVQSCEAPILTITKTANTATATAGGTVRYTITVANAGGTPYTGATLTDALTDVLDDATYNNDAIATGGTVAFTGVALAWTGDLVLGSTVTITYSVTLPATVTGNQRLVNTVVSPTIGSNCALGSTDSRCTVTVPVAGLTIAKSASTANVTPGGTVNYTVTLTNTGQSAYTGISVVDDLTGTLDDATYNGDAAASAGTVAFSNPNLTWTGNVPVGGTVTIAFSVTVNNPDNGDKVLVNTLTTTAIGSNCPVGGTDTRCRLRVNVLVPGLTINKAADAVSTTPGSTVRYTVTIANTGQTGYTGITVTDALADVLDDATYNGDAAATSGTVSFSSPNLVWTGNLPVGAPTVTITYSVTVRAEAGGNHRLVNTMTSTAAGSNCPTGGTDPRCAVSIPVAELIINFTVNSPTVTPGGIVSINASITNIGQVPYTGITLFFVPGAGDLADVTFNGDQTATSGQIVFTPNGPTWTGNVPVGGQVLISGSATVNTPYTGDGDLEDTVNTAAPGSNCPPGGTDPRCSVRITVVNPVLTVVKTADAATAVQGQTVGYTITITNAGNTTYTGASVVDALLGVLDDASYNGNASATSGTLNFTSPNLTWTGDLAVGQTVTVTYSVTVNNPDTGDRRLINTVSSTAAGSSCPPASGNPACTVSLRVLVPGLTVTKSANAVAVTPGGVVGYTVTIANTGSLPYTGAVVTDNLTGVLDDATYNGNAAATSGTVGFTSPNLTWTGDLAVGQTVTVTYSVTVNNPDTGDLQLVNTALSTAPGSNCPVGGTDPRCTVTVPVTGATTLTFHKTADVSVAARGDTITYTITVANSGLTPYLGATFTDSLVDALDAAVYNGDATATAGTVSYVAPDLTWTGDVPANGTVTITYTMTVRTEELPDEDDLVVNALSSPSVGSNCPVAGTDPRCAVTIPVLELDITVTSEPAATTTPGAAVQFTMVILNETPTARSNLRVDFNTADLLDDATPVGDLSVNTGQLTYVTGGFVWTGDLAGGASATIVGTAVVNDPDTGNRLLRLVATSDEVGSSCPTGGTDPDCAAEVTVLVPQLTISKAADAPNTQPGEVVTYTVTVTNTGDTPYTGATVTDDLAGVLDDATYNGDAAATSGALGYTAPTLTWNGDLAVGQSATITYSVTVRDPDPGDKLMVNGVSATDPGSTCPPASANPDCVSSVPVLVPVLTITKSAGSTSTVAGGVVDYTITLTNLGLVPYTGATVTDDLAGVLDDATYNGDATASAGSVGVSGSTLTWTGDLAVGAPTVTITYSVTVDDPGDIGDGRLTNAVSSTAPGNNCPPGGTDPRCVTEVTIAGLVIVNTTDVATTTPGGVVQQQISFTNTGQTPYVGAVVAIPMADVLDDAWYLGDGTVTGGDVNFDVESEILTWTGDLAIGETVLLLASVEVDDPVTGDTVLTSVASSTDPGNNCPTGSTDPRCTSTVDVLIPQLAVSKSADAPATTPGGTVIWTITVANTGETGYPEAVVTDNLSGVLDEATYNGDATADIGAVQVVGTTLTWIGVLAPGEVATITYSATVNDVAGLTAQTLINTVSSVTAGSTCPPGGPGAACLVVVGVQIPELTIIKSTDAPTTGILGGETVTYTITITNTGESAYQGISVADDLTDVLDDATWDDDATATAGTVDLAGTTLTWTGDLTQGAQVIVRYSVTVDPAYPGNQEMTNTVTTAAPGSNCPEGGTDVRCTALVTVLEPALGIGIVASAGSVVEGGTVTYTITLTNAGDLSYVNQQVRNPLAGVLDDAAYNGDATASAGSVALVGDTLVWTGDLLVGAAPVTITYSVTVDVPAAGDQSLVNVVTSDAPGSSCPPPGPDLACTVVTTVIPLAITLTNLTPAFVLSGTPNSTVTGEGVVTMTVTTNSLTGYAVSVQANDAELTPVGGPTDPDLFIAIGNLGVRPSGDGEFQPLSVDTPVVVHSQPGPSAPEGDDLSNDYQVTIPLEVVATDYTATLTYVAMTT